MGLTPQQLRRLRSEPTNGNRIAFARHLVGVTQVEMAKATSLTQSQLSDLERQRYGDTGVVRAGRLADYFGCHIDDLFPRRRQEVA
jgi:transcriptional regulator with XRE-family HTH domain